MRSLVFSVLAVCLLTIGLSGTANAQPATKLVRYDGATARVPRSWPVVDLAAHPTACVRLDRRAVYLGRPGAQESCPGHVVGRRRAILLGGRRTGTSATGGALHADAARASAPAVAANVFRANVVTTSTLGFDSCQAPSQAAMSTWLTASPFRATAIYIGGANSACAQPNLNPAWVSAQSSAGWQLIPTYVGLQAPSSSCGCKTITAAQAATQGSAAAVDAVTQAATLGLGPGNPIYDDMESYTRSASTAAAVLTFLSAWTTTLHAYGYVSGVYGSGLSGMADLVAAQGTTVGSGASATPFAPPDDVWIADWNNQASASSQYVPAADWANNQRLHQYRGGHNDTYGGVKLNIDSDYVDGATASASTGATTPPVLTDGTFVSFAGRTYRIAGGAPMWVHSWSAFGGPQPTVPLTAAEWAALRSTPTDGTFIRATGSGRTYRIAGDSPVVVRSWSPFGGPQPLVVVDAWDIQHAGNSATRILGAPRNGTVVQALPSGRYWLFSSGWRSLTTSSQTAVGVPDAGLSSYLEAPFVTRDALSGVGRRAPQARLVLNAGANAPALRRFVLSLPRGLSVSGSRAALNAGVIVWWAPGGKPLKASVRVSAGRLVITLPVPQRRVLLSLNPPALAASRALATAVRRGTASISLSIAVTDVRRDTANLTLSPRVS